MKEMKERVAKGREISGWEEKRRAFFESRGVRLEEVVDRNESGLLELNERTFLEEQRKKKWGKINESRYNSIV